MTFCISFFKGVMNVFTTPKNFFSIVFFGLVLLCPKVIHAQACTINDNVNIESSLPTNYYTKVAQSFIAPCNGFDQLIIRIRNNPIARSNARFILKRGDPNALLVPFLDDQNDISIPVISNGDYELVIDLSSNVSLISGNEYSFILDVGNGAQPIQLWYDSNNPYANGNLFQLISGSWTELSGQDLAMNMRFLKDDPPTVNCINPTVFLGENGTFAGSASTLAGYNDDIQVATVQPLQVIYTCDDIGETQAETVFVTDSSGQTSSCISNVTVTDVIFPESVTCPNDMVVCGVIPVTYDVPTFSDNTNCLTVTRTSGPASGEVFPIGETTVTYQATDAAGNTATCSFTVTVTEDTIKPTITECPQDVDIDTDDGVCTASNVDLGTPPIASDNCSVTVQPTVEGTVIDLNTYVFSEGQTTVTWVATDASGNTDFCEQLVTVIKGIDPTVICPADVSVNTDAGQCTASNVNLGTPTISADDCAVSSVVALVNGQPIDPTINEFSVGTTTVTWRVTYNDEFSVVTCNQTVTVTDNEVPTVGSCPPDIFVNADTGTCTASNIDIGTPPIGVDNCSVVSVQPTVGGEDIDLSTYAFDIGLTTVTWVITDSSNNSATCDQFVTVTKNIDRTITCPTDITVNTDTGQCTASNVNLGTPVINAEACAVSSIEPQVNGQPIDPATYQFGLGQTVVTWTVTYINDLGTSSCDQTVTVQDTSKPTITECPDQVFVSADTGVCTASNVDLGTPPTVSDNCSVATVQPAVEGTVIDLNTYVFSEGVTTVTWLVTDSSGNTTTCDQLVTVTKDIDPTLTCPTDVSVSADAGECMASNVNLGTPVIGADDCAVLSVEALVGGQPIDPNTYQFVVGETTVTWKVTYIDGFTSVTCNQTVTVLDEEAPTLTTCPTDVVTNASMESCTVTNVDLGTPPIGSDNCSIVSVLPQVNGIVIDPDNYAFELGVTTVTWVATDSDDNTAFCEQLVTVTKDIDPTITCPANITVDTDTGACTASNVNLGLPGINANDCEVASVVAMVNGQAIDPATHQFGLGQTTVTWMVTFEDAVVSSCDQTVTVMDAEAPDAVCQNITVTLDISGVATISTADLEAGSSDLCSSIDTIELRSFLGQQDDTSTSMLTASGQSFTATSTGLLTEIRLRVTDDYNNKEIYFYEGPSGSGQSGQLGTPMHTETGVALTASAPNGWTEITLNTPIPVVEGNQYSFVVSGSTAFSFHDGDPYAGGANIVQYGQNVAGNDLAFELEIEYDATLDGDNAGVNMVPLLVKDTNGNAASCTAMVTVTDSRFITTWQTTAIDESITIPTLGVGYNYTVDWGDGNVTSGHTGDATHKYANPGVHTVSIVGAFPRIFFNNEGDKLKILTVENWGANSWTSMSAAFYGCANLQVMANDAPNLSATDISMQNMFRGAVNFNQNINHWNVVNVNKMNHMFRGAASFNQPLDNWDTRNVTEMKNMFNGAVNFNQNVGSWNLRRVHSMEGMFENVTLSTVIYDAILIGWSTDSSPGGAGDDIDEVPTGISGFNAGNSTYCLGEAARETLMTTYSWGAITDAGKECVANPCDPPVTSNIDHEITCPSDVTVGTDIGTCTASNVDLGLPETNADVCSVYSMVPYIEEQAIDPTTYQFGMGQTTVTWRVSFTDATVSYCDQTVTVVDSGTPNAICQDITVSLDGSGTATITAADLEAGSGGLCSPIDTIELKALVGQQDDTTNGLLTASGQSFTATSTGLLTEMRLRVMSDYNDKEIYFYDGPSGSGQSGQLGTPIYTEANVTLTASAPDGWTTVTLGTPLPVVEGNQYSFVVSGATSFLFHDEDPYAGGSSIVQYGQNVAGNDLAFELEIDYDPIFDSSDIGVNMVPLLVTDENGNTASCTAIVTVIDGRFITTWQTTTIDESITIPTLGVGYNYTVDWGDGNITSGHTGDATHTYANPGVHTVFIIGAFPRIYFNNRGDRLKILTVEQWGVNPWTSMSAAFYGCANLQVMADDAPNLSATDISMRNMFRGAANFNQNINHWNVVNVNKMNHMFRGASSFNQPLDNWDTRNVTEMQNMFNGAINFDQDIGSWDLRRVVNMSGMLANTTLSTINYDAILIGWSTDSSPGGAGDNIDEVPTGISGFNAGNSTYCLGETARETLMTTYGWGTITDAGKKCELHLDVEVFLQGAALNPNTGEENLMRDDLRVDGHIPLSSPYSDALTMEASVLIPSGVDAIVDWVWIEIRDKNDSKVAVEARSALLQRDGDVVDVDGTSPLIFPQLIDDYFVVVAHRNHLGIMSASPIALGYSITNVDFKTNSVSTHGSHARSSFGMPSGVLGMWAGDVNNDGKVIFLNTGAESVEIKQRVLDQSALESPFGASVFYRPKGYYVEDVDMDGEVIFLNAGNELLYVKDNIQAHPGNQIFNSVFFTIFGQLP